MTNSSIHRRQLPLGTAPPGVPCRERAAPTDRSALGWSRISSLGFSPSLLYSPSVEHSLASRTHIHTHKHVPTPLPFSTRDAHLPSYVVPARFAPGAGSRTSSSPASPSLPPLFLLPLLGPPGATTTNDAAVILKLTNPSGNKRAVGFKLKTTQPSKVSPTARHRVGAGPEAALVSSSPSARPADLPVCLCGGLSM